MKQFFSFQEISFSKLNSVTDNISKNVLFILLFVFSGIVNGYSQFGEEQIIVAGHADGPKDIFAADLDGDGDLDIISASYSDNKIAWYENDGTGNFGAQHLITVVTNHPSSVFATDIDGDGDVDVLSASSGDGRIAWYINDGNGNFGFGLWGAQQIIDANANGASSVFSSDLDGDGDMDVLSASAWGNKIAWYENYGSGNFGSQQVITTEADYAQSVFATDLDGDGDMDVLSASEGDDKIAWYENNGSGNFGTQQIITINANGASSVFAADLDGDGDLDVLSASDFDDKIAWYQNDGFGNFGLQQIITIDADGAQSVFATDLDGDGDIDVLSASEGDDKIAWYENDGTGNFGTQQIITVNAEGANSVFATDVNGDGDINVLFASYGDDKIAWYVYEGSGNFGAQQIITAANANANVIRSVFSTDLDGDGDMDVLSASYGDDKIAWYENDGTGNFGAQQIITTNAEEALSVFASDLDGDGDMDVLSASDEDDKIAWYENDGTGNFGTQQIITTNANGASSVFASDIDGDGDMDVLSASSIDDKIAWHENDGTGNFGMQQIITTNANGASSVFAADLDGDGGMDVLSASYYDDKIAWYQNDGLGNFGTQQVITTNADFAQSVFATDLDGDGDTDVLSASSTDDKIAWYENDGSGNFGAQQIITNVNGAKSVFASDLDGDGDLDILSASTYRLTWYENNGSGNFGTQQIISDNISLAQISSVFASDIDGDEDMDVFYASLHDDKIAWYENIINEGCTDEAACNYNSSFVIDNGSCCYDNCGCTNENAENYDSSAACDNGSCILLGCIDNTACNFDFYANQDNSSCTYPGCNDTNADNYDSSAGCNDFSCNYNIAGLVFFDENENGVFDGLDYGLPFQEITSSDDIVYLTNDEGIFYSDATSESITFTLSSNESFPFNTTDNPQTVVNGINTSTNDFSLDFGISSEIPDFAICLDFYPPGSGYPCDDWVNHNLCYRNMGNLPINGVLEVEYDPLFQDYQEVTPIDSVVGNIIYMSFDNLMPGQMYFYDVGFHTPDFESIGEFLTSTGRVYGFYEGNEVAYGESILVHEITCAYDPNDKQVFPAGYAEPHYVLPESRLEYLVRFQNTGNAPATNVTVTDTIDPSLDLTSFELVANSHSVITTIKTEERVIEFLFENIMLPDSTENEPESHGLISYKLTPLNELEYETEINNTAYIYFDNNPPIVTNTTWTTIYDCNDGLAAFEIFDESICMGEEVTFENTQNYVEDYLWFVDNELTSSEQIFSTNFENSTEYSILLEVNNPLCSAVDSISVSVNSNPLPVITVSEDITLCAGESTILTATGGETYDWNGQGTEAELEITPTETTTYEVTATNEFDCSVTDNVEVVVNPTPEITVSDDITLCEGESTVLIATGSDNYDWNGQGTEAEIEVTPTETTTYEVTSSIVDCSTTAEVTVFVNPLPTAEITAEVIILTAVAADTYQWYFNGGLLNGANSQTYTALQNGNYSVAVTNEFDCTTLSNEIIISVVGIDELSSSNIQLFPNPMQEYSILYFGESGVNYQVKLYTTEGKLVQDYGTITDGQLKMERKGLSTGNYLVEVMNVEAGEKFSLQLVVE